MAEAGMRKMLSAALVAALVATAGAAPRGERGDLQLVLAADVSISVDNEEFRLQRQGYAAAITSPRVLDAIAAGPHHAVAFTFIEWSGKSSQRVIADWMVIRDGETAAVFAN